MFFAQRVLVLELYDFWFFQSLLEVDIEVDELTLQDKGKGRRFWDDAINTTVIVLQLHVVDDRQQCI